MSEPSGAGVAAPAPAARQQTADEVIALMSKTPLFMTHLDPADSEENEGIQALKMLAYEGTRAEIAQNFKDQGNEAAKAKLWSDAREYYNKAISALRMSEHDLRKAQNGGVEPEVEEDLSRNTAKMDLKDGERVLDLDAEKQKETKLLEDSHVNRALCNLELKNYGFCIRDCAATITLDRRNKKAYYRSASACLALGRIPDAQDAVETALVLDPNNLSLNILQARIKTRSDELSAQARARHERDIEKLRQEQRLKEALHARGIRNPGDILRQRRKDGAPDLEDAEIKLVSRPEDESSTTSSPPTTQPHSPFGGSHSLLAFPVLLAYPLASQTDFVKQVLETDTLGSHLEYIFPLPWDVPNDLESPGTAAGKQGEYTVGNVECFVESTAGVGKLLKVGKNVVLRKLFETGSVTFTDGLLRVYVVPTSGVKAWVARYKERSVR